jgi:quercetin dioxygenase-like cupin family protein
MTITVDPKHIFTYDGAMLNIYHANVGEGLPRHDHAYAHAIFCAAGRCVIRKENKQVIMDKTTTPINLLENEWHEIEALEDKTVFITLFAKNKI